MNFGPSSVVLPVYFTSIMRESPLPLHGASMVPMPLDPSGQSALGLGGSGVGGGGGGAGATEALGFSAGASGFGSSLQLKSSVPNANATRAFDE